MNRRPLLLAILLGWLFLLPLALSAATGDVPPRPLDDRGLANLTALSRLVGYVRYFHPSDQAAALTNADWDALTMAGVERIEGARDPRELAAALSSLFEGIAPTVQVLPFPLSSHAVPVTPAVSDSTATAPASATLRWIAWRHEGLDLHVAFTSYQSERVEVGRFPNGATATVAQELDVLRLRGHRVRISVSTRLDDAAGQAAIRLSAVPAGGGDPVVFSQTVAGGNGHEGWRRIELLAEVPAGAVLATLSFELSGAGRFSFDDVRMSADGLDLTGQLINPGFEEGLAGLSPRGWIPSHEPFGAEYDFQRVSGATAGRWAGALSSRTRPIGLPIVADLGAGVSAVVPVALPADGQGTLPHASSPPTLPVPAKPAGFVPSGLDRTTRLAGVAVGWGVPQHFYPYFRIVGADWPGALRRGLTSAAIDPDEASYLKTLRRLVTELGDGHARVMPVTLPVRFAFTWDWIENRLVITSVEAGATHGLAPGDQVLSIDGKPVAAALAEIAGLTSAATPQWRLWRSLMELAAGVPGVSATLAVQPRAGGPVRTVSVPYTAPIGSTVGVGGFGSPEEPRPEPIAQVRPGIYYVDLSRVSDEDVEGAIDQLAAADGVVFDMRGYPWLSPLGALQHLLAKPVLTNWFNIPIVTQPDGKGWRWRTASFFLTPLAPRISGRVAFLIDGRVLSFAESLMGIVEDEHLGALVGGPTGGTNGGFDVVPVAGGYSLRYTGMDVLKKDGSPHHGVGIRPTVAVVRTLAGVAAGRDEVLEKGIEVVSRR